MKILIELSGGLEYLFGKQKRHTIEFEKEKVAIRDVLIFMKENLLKERLELFMQGDTVRPGILVLINDADWELEGGIAATVQDNDKVVLISTLHGG